MIIDIQQYKDERLIPFKKQAIRGIPLFIRIYIKDNKLIGETPSGNRVLITDYGEEV